MQERLIAQTLAARRLEAMARPTAAKVRKVWQEAREDAQAVVSAHKKAPSVADARND